MKIPLWAFVPVIIIGVLMVPVLPVNATLLTFDYEVEFSGATPPAGATPWITATFDDSFGGDNTVRLAMSAVNLVGTEFIDDWLFNFDSALDPTLLYFTPVDISEAKPNHILAEIDAFKSDGGGYFDILFDFPPPPGNDASKFTAGESVVYDITYVSPITVAAFNVENSSGLITAAHIQAINGEESGRVTIPDASAVFLLGSSCLMGFAVMRKKPKK